ncbi:MAG: anaerobic ribonucleoside-triphosphate reductase activating protein [Betaproteobacteria bacterium]|nr:anaerobic ribonucleoside-triphosphate reductase activating protein [Betaproteobacteria bacterium]MBI2226186.1 anaerobic ribonucleoside-triphosphate reductase activating protein [Betaproteobacteria bacterium]MBI3055071.1 anaerobic ribonucleoside-triphosphate reductase activating protein [Betaproteobacteria bacterium]
MSASRPRAALRIGGLTPLSLSDWPGQLAAVVFCQGCPWRCGYCHNPHLIPPRAVTSLEWNDVLAFLERRRGLLDAVVFSGGEPTLQAGITRALRQVKALGFKLGLHTAGAYPRRLVELLPGLDWVAMDIKASFADYAATTGVADSGAPALESVRLILASGIAYEFRTTVHPDLLPAAALPALAGSLARLGVRHYALQEFRPQGCASHALNASGTSPYLSDAALTGTIAPLFDSFCVRQS